MGRQRRTHGAQVYCTSSPGDRQHREATTNSESHPAWHRFHAAVNRYDKREEGVFCDPEDHGVNGAEIVAAFFQRRKFFRRGSQSSAPRKQAPAEPTP
jgi:hypothetical protein